MHIKRPYRLLLLLLLACASLVSCAAVRTSTGVGPQPAQRDAALRTVASFRHLGFQVVAAQLTLGVDTARAWRQLDTLLATPTGDIFWMYPATGFYLAMRDRLDSTWRRRFREAWKSFTPYRGDTENHFLMYYGSLLLMSQEWPGLDGSSWFNGKSSSENYAEAHDYLEQWIQDVAEHGLTEWDSPRYLYYYLTPLIILRDHVADARLRHRVEMVLELLLADFAVEYLAGSYCGAHSRDSDGAVLDPRRAEATSYAQFYFEDSLSFVLPDLAFAALSGFECPPVIRAMAHQRATPYLHTELRRSRAIMRFDAQRYRTGLKRSYMTAEYCLGSVDGGLMQPIQQHSWDVTFAAPRPNNTVFALHPTWSARELGTWFPEVPDLMVQSVARAKATYTSPDKWLGGSPREMLAQDRNVLVALYPIADDDPVRHIDLYLPGSADTIVSLPGGWRFVRFGGANVAVLVVADSVEEIAGASSTRVRGHVARGSTTIPAVLVVCGRSAEVSFEDFVRTVGAQRWAPRFDARDLSGEAQVTGATGEVHTLRWSDSRAGSAGMVARGALFDGPFITSEVGSGIIRMSVAGLQRVLDFTR